MTMFLFILFFISNFPKNQGLRISNYNDNKNYRYNDASYSYNKSNHPGKTSTVEDDEIEIVITRPAFNRNY